MNGIQVIDADVADGGIKYLAAGACYSDDAPFETARYRYHLWRTWDFEKPPALFVMLNPSTATHLELDPTLRRCKQFAIDWNCGGFEVVNLFAFRATKPGDMKAAADPVGEKNDDIISLRAALATSRRGYVIAAYGQHGKFSGRAEAVRHRLKNIQRVPLYYLRMGADNMPWHPLYLPADLKPTEWS